MLVSVITAVPATIAALGSWRNGFKIDKSRHELAEASRQNLAATSEVHKEVKTINGLSIAELADADESRRIAVLSARERTDADDEHVEANKGPTAAAAEQTQR